MVGLVAVVVAVAVPFVVARLNEPTWPYRAGFAESWAIGSTDGGTAARSGSAYLLTANPGWRLWKSAPVAEPDVGVVVSARARIEEGSGDFGVWCRGTTGGDRYEFAVTGAGKASITKRRAGQKPVVLFGPADVKTNRDTSIVAECKTDGQKVALGLTVNGDKVGQATDADRPYAPGGTGVHAAPDDGKTLHVRFASFTVQPVKRAAATSPARGAAVVGPVRGVTAARFTQGTVVVRPAQRVPAVGFVQGVGVVGLVSRGSAVGPMQGVASVGPARWVGVSLGGVG